MAVIGICNLSGTAPKAFKGWGLRSWSLSIFNHNHHLQYLLTSHHAGKLGVLVLVVKQRSSPSCFQDLC
jgi:hypothetical protein